LAYSILIIGGAYTYKERVPSDLNQLFTLPKVDNITSLFSLLSHLLTVFFFMC